MHVTTRLGMMIGLAAALAIGIGTLNCYLFSIFPAWERIWMVITRPLFIVSGVFFLFEDIPSNYQPFLWINPLFHVTGEMRKGFYPTYDPNYVSPQFVYGISFVLCLLGLLLLRRFHDDIVHK